MKTFYQLLLNSIIAGVTNNFVWFALIFWAYLETKSVLVTSFAGGIFLTASALTGIWFGSIVDHHKKKSAMLGSSIVTLLIFTIGLFLLLFSPESSFQDIHKSELWLLIVLLLMGVVVGNIRNIAMPTLVTILVPEDSRDRANGMLGTAFGIAFGITSVGSGLALAYLSMVWVMIIAVFLTLLAIFHLLLITIPEKGIVHIAGASGEKPKSKTDIRGTIKAVAAVPGLFALIFFTTFNNFLGGVFMSLMDAYGLSLMSVQHWGFLWGLLSTGFILGGLIIAKKGLGKNPLRTLFIANICMWIVSILFTVQASIVLLAIGMFVWICLSPFIEAAEHTIIQKVVPLERQGRVFGFAQSIEQSASPLTAFMIGPIAHYIFIPFMTTGRGVDLIGSWFGVGTGRGIALVFILTGIAGLITTLTVMKSMSYKLLSRLYDQ